MNSKQMNMNSPQAESDPLFFARNAFKAAKLNWIGRENLNYIAYNNCLMCNVCMYVIFTSSASTFHNKKQANIGCKR